MKIKKIIYLILIFCLLLTSGCIKRDDFEDITIYTTVYPIEYLIDQIYGESSTVKSIYPDGIDINKYTLTNKQIRDYSKSELFVYNGLTKEKQIAAKFINNNKNIKIIDVTQGLEYTNNVEELWVSPANYLMMAQNIKNNLKEYISNKYIRDEIDNKYKVLKVNISEIDAELKIVAENADNKTIIVGNKMYKFLEKYGFDVICLDEKDSDFSNLTVRKARNLLETGTNDYIFVKSGETVNSTINKLVNDNNIELIELKSGTNLTEEERKENKDYLTILNENLELIKKEMYE